jgi:hypothetical protein
MTNKEYTVLRHVTPRCLVKFSLEGSSKTFVTIYQTTPRHSTEQSKRVFKAAVVKNFKFLQQRNSNFEANLEGR